MDLRTPFPVLDNYTYLNTAGSGLLSKTACDWRKNHDAFFLDQGSNFRLNQLAFFQEVRVHLADFFKAKVANTFLVPNFSFGFNSFLSGLSSEHRFLLISDDYPSLTFPIQNAGFVSKYILFDEAIQEKIREEIKLFKPTVFAFSIVQYISGLKINLDFIKQLKKDFPDLMILADGTQFCGTQHFNFEESGLDVLISSGYKWMLGGYGNGFLFIKESVAQHLFNDKKRSSMPVEPFLKDRTFLSFCFEPGHLDTLNFGTLKQSLLYFEQIGIELIEQKITEISTHAKAELSDRGLLSKVRVQQKDISSIFNISANEALIQKLKEANILFSPRGNGVRVSFHFYNTESDLQNLLRVIDSK